MNYSEFFRFLQKWRQAKRYPTAGSWPNEITLDRRAWDGIERLYNLTQMDGHEYETSFFYLDGETYLSTPLRGTTNEVRAQHSLQVNYQIDQAKRVYYRNVVLDGKLINKTVVTPESIKKPTQVGFLFNIHSHPEHVNFAQQVTYSFFSDTDIRSLLASDALVSGLVTDSFWLVVKTDKSISKIGEVGEEMLREISEKSFSGEQYLNDIIIKNMSRWGLIFYKGNLRSTLYRVN